MSGPVGFRLGSRTAWRAAWVIVSVAAASQVYGDIYEWTISGGSVVQSPKVCPGGSGVYAVPNANLANLDLTQAYLIGAYLNSANLSSGTLTNANLATADLTDANLFSATLTNANLTDSILSIANLSFATLSGATLTSATLNDGTVLTNANLTNADLTNAAFYAATLTNANLTNAIITGAYFGYTNLTASQLYSTASYKAQNLQRIKLVGNDLTGWNFSSQNLTYARLSDYATLTGADFTNATVTGADFSETNLTSSQLYSTNSYLAQNLQGIGLAGNDLTGWSFSAQNLTKANFSSGTLTNANLSGADLRGATGFSGSSAGAITTNTIFPDGTVHGLSLNSTNPMLLVRNYSGTSSIPIHIQENMTLTQNASLVLEFDGNPWGSTISFDSGIPVTLGGNLELDVVAGVNPVSLVGDSFQAFNWTGVSPSGQFASITNDLPPGYSWDTSQLYTTGNVTLVPEPSTFALFAATAIGLVRYGLRRRRKKRVAPVHTGE